MHTWYDNVEMIWNDACGRMLRLRSWAHQTRPAQHNSFNIIVELSGLLIVILICLTAAARRRHLHKEN